MRPRRSPIPRSVLAPLLLLSSWATAAVARADSNDVSPVGASVSTERKSSGATKVAFRDAGTCDVRAPPRLPPGATPSHPLDATRTVAVDDANRRAAPRPAPPLPSRGEVHGVPPPMTPAVGVSCVVRLAAREGGPPATPQPPKRHRDGSHLSRSLSPFSSLPASSLRARPHFAGPYVTPQQSAGGCYGGASRRIRERWLSFAPRACRTCSCVRRPPGGSNQIAWTTTPAATRWCLRVDTDRDPTSEHRLTIGSPGRGTR